MNRSPADFLRDIRIRNEAAARYDGFAEDLSRLGDEMATVGAGVIADQCRQFAYVAWRAAQAEHLDPDPEDQP
jgi:hypothetical protein